ESGWGKSHGFLDVGRPAQVAIGPAGDLGRSPHEENQTVPPHRVGVAGFRAGPAARTRGTAPRGCHSGSQRTPTGPHPTPTGPHPTPTGPHPTQTGPHPTQTGPQPTRNTTANRGEPRQFLKIRGKGDWSETEARWASPPAAKCSPDVH